MKHMATVFLTVAALTIGGCSSTQVVQGPVSGSIGQQLIDLKKAYEVGAVSKRDYEDQREKLIDSVR